MKRTLRWFALVAAATALFAFLVPAAPAAAAGISADPTWGGLDTTFTIQANGFQRYEIVDTWVGLPNLSAVGTGTQRADASGRVVWSFKPKASYGGGEYIAVAHGRVSGEVATKFNVGVPIDNNPTPVPPKPYIGTLAERTVQFGARGYAGGETVVTWFQDPSGHVTSYQTFVADAWGNLSFPFTVGPSWTYGGYQLVGRGLKSGNTQWIQFAFFGRITGGESSAPILNSAPYYDLWLTGYLPGETVSIWLSFPNGTTQAIARTTATAGGNVYYRVNVQPGWPYGGYVVAAYGWRSHVSKAHTFAYFDGKVS